MVGRRLRSKRVRSTFPARAFGRRAAHGMGRSRFTWNWTRKNWPSGWLQRIPAPRSWPVFLD